MIYYLCIAFACLDVIVPLLIHMAIKLVETNNSLTRFGEGRRPVWDPRGGGGDVGDRRWGRHCFLKMSRETQSEEGSQS